MIKGIRDEVERLQDWVMILVIRIYNVSIRKSRNGVECGTEGCTLLEGAHPGQCSPTSSRIA